MENTIIFVTFILVTLVDIMIIGVSYKNPTFKEIPELIRDRLRLNEVAGEYDLNKDQLLKDAVIILVGYSVALTKLLLSIILLIEMVCTILIYYNLGVVYLIIFGAITIILSIFKKIISNNLI